MCRLLQKGLAINVEICKMSVMHELVQSVKEQVSGTRTSLRKVAKGADVNYWWLVKFKTGDTSGMSAKGLAYVEKLQRFFREAA